MPHFWSKNIAQMEFRIFHTIFCELFRIQKKAFAFDEYIQNIYEKFVLSIIEIRITNWFFFLLFLLLNLLRTDSGGFLFKCALHDEECKVYGAVYTFTIAGLK